ncbi:MAG: TrkA family potassium uptake protein [Chloroflexi bacterium]|nr:TrkA family potassium uptake protein [Chloroflexota bacterium]
MYIIIVGCGKVGYHLLKALITAGHEVLAIEQDPPRHARIVEELGSVAISGDGSEAALLAEAGANRADVLVAVTGHDEDNLVACQVAKHRFNVKKTIALVNDPSNEKLFKSLGVDVVVSHTNIILAHVEGELTEQPLIHLMPVPRSNLRLVDIHVPPDAEVVGKPLHELVLPPNSLISLVVNRKGQPRIPKPGQLIEPNDEVIAITPPEADEELIAIFTRVGR